MQFQRSAGRVAARPLEGSTRGPLQLLGGRCGGAAHTHLCGFRAALGVIHTEEGVGGVELQAANEGKGSKSNAYWGRILGVAAAMQRLLRRRPVQ